MTRAPPAVRLQALAHYLELDWAWLTHRCAALSRARIDVSRAARSRLVSPAGLDTACAFVGSLATAH